MRVEPHKKLCVTDWSQSHPHPSHVRVTARKENRETFRGGKYEYNWGMNLNTQNTPVKMEFERDMTRDCARAQRAATLPPCVMAAELACCSCCSLRSAISSSRCGSCGMASTWR